MTGPDTPRASTGRPLGTVEDATCRITLERGPRDPELRSGGECAKMSGARLEGGTCYDGRTNGEGTTGEPRRELRSRRMHSAISIAANNKRIARAVTSARQLRNAFRPPMLGGPTLRGRAEAVKKVSGSRTSLPGFPEVAVVNAEPRTSVEKKKRCPVVFHFYCMNGDADARSATRRLSATPADRA